VEKFSALWETTAIIFPRCGQQRGLYWYFVFVFFGVVAHNAEKLLPLWETTRKNLPRCRQQRRKMIPVVVYNADK
jgi:hypothetical protein